MESYLSKNHNLRNIAVCICTSFTLFLLGSLQTLAYLLADKLPRNAQIAILSVELSITATAVVSLIAIPLGYTYMYLFGGVVSTKAIKLYLFVTRGRTVIAAKSSELDATLNESGFTVGLRRQTTYFLFILAVVVSFAIYLSKHGVLPVTSPLAKSSDAISAITQDYSALAIFGSLMVPIVALTLPYFGGLRLRTIDVGPFHTTILTFVIGASGGFTLLYSILARPTINLLLYYFLLFMGVCWSFAFGCNLAADTSNRRIVRDVLSDKRSSKLITSKIYIENPPGKFIEV